MVRPNNRFFDRFQIKTSITSLLFTCNITNVDSGKNSEWAQFQYFIYGREGTDGELKRVGITQNEMKSGEGYSKWKEVFH